MKTFEELIDAITKNTDDHKQRCFSKKRNELGTSVVMVVEFLSGAGEI